MKDDRTAVFVDARAPDKFNAETIPGAVNVRRGEGKVANEDGRLPHTDKGTRIVVFSDDVADARSVATEVSAAPTRTSAAPSFGKRKSIGLCHGLRTAQPKSALLPHATIVADSTI